MKMPRSVGQWLRLPSRIALILGMGALSTAGARADAPEIGPGATISPAGRGEVLIQRVAFIEYGSATGFKSIGQCGMRASLGYMFHAYGFENGSMLTSSHAPAIPQPAVRIGNCAQNIGILLCETRTPTHTRPPSTVVRLSVCVDTNAEIL